MKSARGIYYDLKESEYSLSIYTNSETLTFYFSSLFLKKKYEENIKNYVENQNLKLTIAQRDDLLLINSGAKTAAFNLSEVATPSEIVEKVYKNATYNIK